mmetsp:Transcript_4191/g.10621  ORF Transcript_4191/g.10621 Transcript_4191/m.10621 type:complete len:292 (-) Transcript_4191:817-1692(-)
MLHRLPASPKGNTFCCRTICNAGVDAYVCRNCSDCRMTVCVSEVLSARAYCRHVLDGICAAWGATWPFPGCTKIDSHPFPVKRRVLHLFGSFCFQSLKHRIALRCIVCPHYGSCFSTKALDSLLPEFDHLDRKIFHCECHLMIHRLRTIVRHGIVKHQQEIILELFPGSIVACIDCVADSEEIHRPADNIEVSRGHLLGDWFPEYLIFVLLLYLVDDAEQVLLWRTWRTRLGLRARLVAHRSGFRLRSLNLSQFSFWLGALGGIGTGAGLRSRYKLLRRQFVHTFLRLFMC